MFWSIKLMDQEIKEILVCEDHLDYFLIYILIFEEWFELHFGEQKNSN